MPELIDTTEEQKELLKKNHLNPERWYFYEETKKTIVFLDRRGMRRTIAKENEHDG